MEIRHMDVNPELWKRRENGTVDQIEIPREDWPFSSTNSLLEKKIVYRWQPPYQLGRNLPDWYDLCLTCDVGKDGIRRFSPVGRSLSESLSRSQGLKFAAETQGLLLVASIGGHAILIDRGEIERGLPFDYHEARLFSQYVRHLREYLGNTVKLGRVLGVCAGGRATRDIRNILPEDLGLDSLGNGVRWDLRQLKEEGILGASNAGIDNPSPDLILRYGLLHAAMRNPLCASQKGTKSLIRMTLFDLGPTSPELSKGDIRYVAEKVSESLKDHLYDTTDKFASWLEDPKSNLINRISKRVDCRLSRQQVRKALLELGWQSIEMVGRCVGKQMAAFRDALPDPLTDAEEALFSPIYVSHPAYGDLPLLLLHDRFEFLQESILRTWHRPNDEHTVGIVHRMMFYYAELISSRRASDRLYKQRSKAKTSGGRVAREETIPDNVSARRCNRSQEVFMEIARRLMTRRESELDFDADEWDARLIDQSPEQIVLQVFCAQRQFDRTYYVPTAEFEAEARKVAAEEDL